jgi:hypothetical protein
MAVDAEHRDGFAFLLVALRDNPRTAAQSSVGHGRDYTPRDSGGLLALTDAVEGRCWKRNQKGLLARWPEAQGIKNKRRYSTFEQ